RESLLSVVLLLDAVALIDITRVPEPSESLQGLDDRLELAGDFFGSSARRKSDGGANSNNDLAEAGEPAALALHLPDAVEPHGYNGNPQIFREQADAGLKRRHAAVLGVVHQAFGKNQNAIAAAHGLARKAEAFPEAGELRERKNVEERDDQPVAKLVGPAFCEKPVAWGMAHVLQRFAAHRRGETVAESMGKRGKDQSDVGAARDVIGNHEERPRNAAEVFAAHDFGMAQNLRCRPN